MHPQQIKALYILQKLYKCKQQQQQEAYATWGLFY